MARAAGWVCVLDCTKEAHGSSGFLQESVLVWSVCLLVCR